MTLELNCRNVASTSSDCRDVYVCCPAGIDLSPEPLRRLILETGFISVLADLCMTPRWGTHPFSLPCEDDGRRVSFLMTGLSLSCDMQVAITDLLPESNWFFSALVDLQFSLSVINTIFCKKHQTRPGQILASTWLHLGKVCESGNFVPVRNHNFSSSAKQMKHLQRSFCCLKIIIYGFLLFYNDFNVVVYPFLKLIFKTEQFF